MGSFAASAFAIAAFSVAAFDFDATPVSPEQTYSRGVALYPADEPFFDYNRQRREDDSLLLLLL